MRDPPDGLSDDQLVSAANAGDAEAFDHLYRRYRDWVYAVALRHTGDRDLALDVTQEAFLYLLGKFPGFRLEAALKTVLYPVVRHRSITLASRQRRGRGSGDVLAGLPAPEPAPAPGLAAEGLEALSAAVAALPAGQREVLLLRFADRLALAEIAGALGVPLGTVKSRLHHALSTLRDDERARKYFFR